MPSPDHGPFTSRQLPRNVKLLGWASMFFGELYQAFGPLAAFGSGAGLALLAAVLLMRL